MDLGFWMSSSASTSNALHVHSAQHTAAPGPLDIDDGDDGLGQTGEWCNEGTGSMSVLVRDRPVPGTRQSRFNENVWSILNNPVAPAELINLSKVIERQPPSMEGLLLLW